MTVQTMPLKEATLLSCQRKKDKFGEKDVWENVPTRSEQSAQVIVVSSVFPLILHHILLVACDTHTRVHRWK